MLPITSLGFGIVAFGFRGALRPILMMLMGTSVLHHSFNHIPWKGRNILQCVDIGLAHTVLMEAVRRVICLQPLPSSLNSGFVSIVTWLTWCFHIKRLCHKPGAAGKNWHMTIHASALLGLAMIADAERKAMILRMPVSSRRQRRFDKRSGSGSASASGNGSSGTHPEKLLT